MQTVACPSCGGPVEFKSRAAVMAVCGYCKSTILKDADSIKDIGKMSDVLADYSPIQLGTSGEFDGRHFDVIGRIQLRYSAGMWNEWYLLFNDGSNGWLSDASGQFAITTERAADAQPIPAFANLRIGQRYSVGGVVGIASDLRTAECIGGQGELPFVVGRGYQTRVADFRNQGGFVTADYGDALPKLYVGRTVTLAQLAPQLLRDDTTVRDASGKITTPVQRLACPSCGGSVPLVPGLTTHSICPSCHQPLDTNTTVARALEVTRRMERSPTTFELGATATIAGVAYELIGLLRQRENDGGSWTEYLLYSPRAGLLWLIETDEGWYQAKVQDIWPQWDGGAVASLGDKQFRQIAGYTATVDYAIGAFNWKVCVGDTVQVTEFEVGRARLAAERSADELVWSLATLVAPDQIKAWFGSSVKASAVLTHEQSLQKLAIYFVIGLGLANAFPLLFAADDTWLPCILAGLAIYFPAKWIESDGRVED